jgi:hypothetical protein
LIRVISLVLSTARLEEKKRRKVQRAKTDYIKKKKDERSID